MWFPFDFLNQTLVGNIVLIFAKENTVKNVSTSTVDVYNKFIFWSSKCAYD